jgi:cell division protein FtsW
MLIASGITIWIATQALVNMGAVTASLPITGVPLPLVSFGGSSLVVSLVAMGILTNIGRAGKAKKLRASIGREQKAGSSSSAR